MSQRANSTLIGAFVVGAIAVAVTAFLALGNVGLFEDREKIIMYFTGSVDGLNKGAPVNVRGVKVGTVIDINIEFNPADGDFYIPVIVQFEPDAIADVRQINVPDPDQDHLKYMIEVLGLRAQLQLQSLLTSQMAIQLDYRPDAAIEYHGDGSLREIPTIPRTFEVISEQLQDLPLEQILNDITSSLAAINEIVSSPEVEETMVVLKQTLKSIDALAENINRSVQPLAEDTAETLLDAQNTLHEADVLLGNMQLLVSQDSAQVYNLNVALEEIVNAARSIRIFAETVERQPETLLKGKNPRN
ncbi:MAG: MlaD family protein [Gammaproteobacteria bacterium]|jgi:paraquat-inducible protein B